MNQNHIGRRSFVFGGFITAVTGFFSSSYQQLGLDRWNLPKDSGPQDDHQTLSARFLEASRDAENYVKQLEVMKSEVIQNLKQSRPDKVAQIEGELSEDFWHPHHENLRKGFYKDIENNLSSSDLEKALDFFSSEAGQNYLRWKTYVQGRESNVYRAVDHMHKGVGQVIRRVLDKDKDHKWKLS